MEASSPRNIRRRKRHPSRPAFFTRVLRNDIGKKLRLIDLPGTLATLRAIGAHINGFGKVLAMPNDTEVIQSQLANPIFSALAWWKPKSETAHEFYSEALSFGARRFTFRRI
jgi:hypothetical protein